jgi:hypothetical protein
LQICKLAHFGLIRHKTAVEREQRLGNRRDNERERLEDQRRNALKNLAVLALENLRISEFGRRAVLAPAPEIKRS